MYIVLILVAELCRYETIYVLSYVCMYIRMYRVADFEENVLQIELFQLFQGNFHGLS